MVERLNVTRQRCCPAWQPARPHRVRSRRQAALHGGPMPPEIDQGVEFCGGEFAAAAIGITRTPLAVSGRHHRDPESELVHWLLLRRAGHRCHHGRVRSGADRSACSERFSSTSAGVQPP